MSVRNEAAPVLEDKRAESPSWSANPKGMLVYSHSTGPI